MKKSEILEGVIILLSAVLLLLIWAASSQAIQFPPTLVKVLSFLQYPLVIVLAVIFIRRLRRIIRAFRENKNRPGPF
jgi:TRAP-type C4-dicarboxylate transport system permease small subunit